MHEYTYTRELIAEKYNVDSGKEKTALIHKIKEALPNESIIAVVCDHTSLKVIMENELDTLDEGILDNVVQDHKDDTAINILTHFKINNSTDDPRDIDVRIQGFFRDDTFDNLGALTVKSYYRNYDSGVYSDLVVKDEYVYTYNQYTGLVEYRDETLTFYCEDDSVGITKTFRKYYDDRMAIIESNMRRQNLTDIAQAYGKANISGYQPDGTHNGHHFFLQIKLELENYLVGVLKEDLITKIQGMTEDYLTQEIKDGMCDIFDYWS